MRINLSEVEERSFEAIPAGRYVVEFTGHEMQYTKDKPENKLPGGTPMINWETTVVRDAKTGEETYKGRKLWFNSIIHEKTLFNLKSVLKACGWTDQQLNDPEGIDFNEEDVIGNQVVAVVAVRQYDGDDRNDVKRVLPLSAEQRESTSSMLP